MASNGIGVTFIPSTQNQQAQGPGQGAREGDLSGGRSSDLGTAYKILSLRLPNVVSTRAPAQQGLLQGAGAMGLKGLGLPAAGAAPEMPGAGGGESPVSFGGGGGYDPMSVAFEALLRALSGDSGSMAAGGPAAAGDPMAALFGGARTPSPNVSFGGRDPSQDAIPDQPAADPIGGGEPAMPPRHWFGGESKSEWGY